MTKKVRAHVIFRGRVQGVFFRAHTQEFAEQLGVYGWVRNAPDGSVEAVFEGTEDKVKRLIELCKYHQPYAKVTSADIRWEPYKGEFHSFRIRYAF